MSEDWKGNHFELDARIDVLNNRFNASIMVRIDKEQALALIIHLAKRIDYQDKVISICLGGELKEVNE